MNAEDHEGSEPVDWTAGDDVGKAKHCKDDQKQRLVQKYRNPPSPRRTDGGGRVTQAYVEEENLVTALVCSRVREGSTSDIYDDRPAKKTHALGDGMLGELSGEDEADRGLDFAGRDRALLVVRRELRGFTG